MPIELPVLTPQSLQVLKVPPAPADPPVSRDIAKACLLFQDASNRATHHHDGVLISDDDICNAATYATQLLATRVGQRDLQADIVAAIENAMPAMLQPIQDSLALLEANSQQTQGDIQRIKADLTAVKRDIRHNRRISALTWNNNARPTNTASFEIVPFANLDDPTAAPHNLPPLQSPAHIRELRRHLLRAYVRGYHPGLEAPHSDEECIRLVFRGIGAYSHVRE
ncbi:hypothetical protein HGRIS_005421 [Hohenbuehelia grisea]|uniref:Mug135-like C-terminal domain-containing protein n=1 Tax=Hohenbuehelia grisea TaxID=104357 RepID=A0ABR3JWS7_9AGAR